MDAFDLPASPWSLQEMLWSTWCQYCCNDMVATGTFDGRSQSLCRGYTDGTSSIRLGHLAMP